MASLKNHPGMWLRDDAAAAINALEDKYGVITINSAGRTVAEQQDLIDRYDAGDPDVFIPMRPPEESTHVKFGGIAVDVYNYTDDRAKLNEFGFEWFGPRDVVHYTFTGWAGSAALEGNQRRAGSNGVRARRAPSTSAEVVDASFLAEGEVGTFAGYVTGENVDGENRWAKGAFSGLFFWLGGLTPQNVDGLPLLDAPKPTLRADQRQADADGVKGRQAPNTAAAQVGFLDPNDVGDFNGWAHGQTVDGEDRWLRGAYSGAWFWLGGLSPRTVDGLAEVKPGTTPPVTPKPDPAGPPARPNDDPAVPGLWLGKWSANRESRTGRVQYFVVHHAADTRAPEVQVQRFMSPNDREVSPTWFIGADGTARKIVHPDDRQWTTGRIIDQQAVTVETQNTTGAPAWGISVAAHEQIAQLVAWAAKRYGFPIDRDHVLGHNEARAKLDPSIGATACPGPSMDLDWIVKRAQEHAAGNPPPAPGPPILTPEAAGFWQWLFDLIKGFFTKGAK